MKLNDKTIKIICDCLEQGLSIRSACGLANISEATYYRWIKEHDHFRIAVNETYAKFEYNALSEIRKQGEKHWKAIAWILERRFPDAWSKNRKIEIVDHSENNKGENAVLNMLNQLKDHREKKICCNCNNPK